MEQYQLSPSDLLMVDDLPTGRNMAQKVGVPVAFAGWSRQNCPELYAEMKNTCDAAFDTAEELYDYLFKTV
jgi:hypothetical protein